jgi:hypothetical protein
VLQNKIVYRFRHGHASQWAVDTGRVVSQADSGGPRYGREGAAARRSTIVADAGAGVNAR